jgi:hypothetical protein
MYGCSEEPVATLGGAGLRLELPAGADTLDWLRVEIWHDNSIPPELCSLLSTEATPRTVLAQPGTCSRRSIEIRNLLGETVRSLEESPTPNRTWAWDQLDGEGNLVPAGIYPTVQTCEEGTGANFTGHYYTTPRDDRHPDQWILWSGEIDPGAAGRRWEVSPLPEFFWITWWVDDGQDGCAQVSPQFASPFLLRVLAPGMSEFEQEISLVEEAFTEVTVVLAPEPGTVP